MATTSFRYTKMRALILLCVLGTALAAIPPLAKRDDSGKRQPQRVVGGEDTDISRYPFMTNMEHHWWAWNWWTQWCGGSLIAPTAVLSAAHCYIGDRASEWRVRLGSTSATTGGSIIYVSQLILHPQYSNVRLVNDVAVIRLSSAATLSSTIGLARLAGPAFSVPDMSVASVIGWGALWSGGPSSDTLQQVDVNIINQELCAERYAHLQTLPGFGNWPDITSEMICAGILDEDGKDACQGDSGGPMAQNGVVVGIVSWGRGCADAFYPGVNARVSAFTNFIVSNAL